MLDNKNPNEFDDIYSGNTESTSDIPQKSADADTEASYEWNTEKTDSRSGGSEYHYSYVNGNNRDASHNPNRYNGQTGYSSQQSYSSQSTGAGYSNNYQNQNSGAYNNYQSNSYQSQQAQNVYNSQPYGTAPAHTANAKPHKVKKPK